MQVVFFALCKQTGEQLQGRCFRVCRCIIECDFCPDISSLKPHLDADLRFMAVGTAAGVAAKQVVSGAVATVQDVNVTIVQDILTHMFDQV